MGVKNDVSFVIDSRLNLYEHQSTVNPNMPTCFLIYIAHLVDGMIRHEELHSSQKKLLSLPEFGVFYNGRQEQPERQILRLSDLYSVPSDDPSLELKVTVLNINPGMNEALKEKCLRLSEYVEFIERVRCRIAEGVLYRDAVHDTVEECIRQGILSDYLLKNREAVTSMLLENYDEQAVREVFRKDGIAEGRAEGKAEGIDEGKMASIAELMKNGHVSEDKACELLGIFGDGRTRLLKKMASQRQS